MRKGLLSFTATVVLAGAPAHAHHAIASIYDSRNPMTFEAVVVDFQFVNPHPFLIVETVDRGERPQQWRLELDNRFELSGVGITAATWRKGDGVTVTGSQARDGSRALYVRRLDRPADGFWYEQVGSSPKVGRRQV
jgi:hypothetical protein